MPKVPDFSFDPTDQLNPLLGGGRVSPQNLLMAAADMQDRGRLTHDSFKPTKPTGPVNLHARTGGKAGKLR